MSEAVYWIIGDNILECERALELLGNSLYSKYDVALLDSPPYTPRFRVSDASGEGFEAELYPGYGRWDYDVAGHLRELGAPLREAADAMILKVEQAGERCLVVPVLGFEFCGALPAGNNAWQRSGRAVALAEAGVPYLYFAELGGVEMDAERTVKAARFPNPLVPFAYLSLGETSGSIAMPVFDRSPSIPERKLEKFGETFGLTEARAVIRDILTGADDPAPALRALEERALATVRTLSDERRSVDTLRGDEWGELAARKTGEDRAAYLIGRQLAWRKKTSIDVTGTFRPLMRVTLERGAVAAGATDVPICVLPGQSRERYSAELAELYEGRLSQEFIEWLARDVPLVLVWIAGFKPRGDDSRPDRGLMPLAHMIFGTEGVDYMAVIYGPGTQQTWQRFENDLEGLARDNGLWEAIVGLSDAILVDSLTATNVAEVGKLVDSRDLTGAPESRGREAPARLVPRVFGEQDVDSVLHGLFGSGSATVFEAMCNPPGGDWSGLSVQDAATGDVFRWTSLPRVTAEGSKRPDHVAILHHEPSLIVAVESKDAAANLETGIGPRLIAYVDRLLDFAPTIGRKQDDPAWKQLEHTYARPDAQIVSAVAFEYRGEDFDQVAVRTEADALIGIQFLGGEERVLLHVRFRPVAEGLARELVEMADHFGGRIEVDVDRLEDGV